MASPLVLSDISLLPYITVGDGILVAVGGIFLSLAVFKAGIILRSRNRDIAKRNNESCNP